MTRNARLSLKRLVTEISRFNYLRMLINNN